jgi:hypothetical protein
MIKTTHSKKYVMLWTIKGYRRGNVWAKSYYKKLPDGEWPTIIAPEELSLW